MSEPVWLLKPAVIAVHHMMIARFGGPEGVRDEGLLDAALARPTNLFHYDERADLPSLAAAYAAGIIRNHPFVDGNKRSGLMAARTFLIRNEAPFQPDQATVVTMTRALAAGEVDERDYAAWIRREVPVRAR